MKTVRIKEHHCPNCKSQIDAISDLIGKDTPSVGDFSCCCYCGIVFKVGIGWSLTPVDESEIPKDVLAQIKEIQILLPSVFSRHQNN